MQLGGLRVCETHHFSSLVTLCAGDVGSIAEMFSIALPSVEEVSRLLMRGCCDIGFR